MSTYAILTTLVMLALESRTAVAVDIPGVYIHIDMLDFVIVIFRGTYVKVLCDVNVKYKTYINTRNRKEVIYLKLSKALYGCINLAMLRYNLFRCILDKLGFKVNPYD